VNVIIVELRCPSPTLMKRTREMKKWCLESVMKKSSIGKQGQALITWF
jgi:hypothetical protein